MNKIRNVVLEILLATSILFCFLLFRFYYKISFRYVANSPELAYMQYPILTFCYIIIITMILALSMGLFLVHRSNKNNIFEKLTTKVLYTIGHCFILSFIVTSIIFVYAFVNIQWEIGMVSVFLFALMFLTFLGANVFYFISNLFSKAISYKDENEMTV